MTSPIGKTSFFGFFRSSPPEEDLNRIISEANRGDATAQNKLGKMYRFARGVPLSYDESVKWFTRAARQGHKEALDFLIDFSRWGGNEDLGYNVAAQFNLGEMYRDGIGVPPSNNEALYWFNQTVKYGHRQGKLEREKLVSKLLT